jgi:hypothetical protein
MQSPDELAAKPSRDESFASSNARATVLDSAAHAGRSAMQGCRQEKARRRELLESGARDYDTAMDTLIVPKVDLPLQAFN